VILFGLDFEAIFQVAETGGKVTPVTQLDKGAEENSHRYPVFLPDGNQFLYFVRSDDPDKRGIFLDSLDHGRARRRVLIADGLFALGRDPDDQSYYLLSPQAGKIAAQRFDIDGGELVGGSHILLDRGGAISVSDTGVLVVRTYEESPLRLVWRDRAGAELGTLGSSDDYWSVSLSPDDRYAAIIKHSGNGQFRIWMAAVANGLLEPFSDSTHASSLAWASDSNTIYYSDRTRQTLFSRKVDPRGPETAEGATGSEVLVADLSVDRRYLASELIKDVTHSEAAWADLRGDLKPEQWHLLGASGPWGLRPTFSPDGRWIAFGSAQTGRTEVYVMDFPNGLHRMRVSTAGGKWPRWRGDGKELFYVAADGSLMSVVISTGAQLGVGTPKRLFATNFDSPSLGPGYAVARDGKRFLLIDRSAGFAESSIEMVLNWPSLLPR
jgi:Tol biopolymer transport system component